MLNKLIADLKKNRGFVAAYLFGSYGTGRETPLSDIDICVFTKDVNHKTILNAYSYAGQKIDISVFDTLPLHLKPEVFKGKPLFVKDKYFIANKFAKSFREDQDFKKYPQLYFSKLKQKLAK